MSDNIIDIFEEEVSIDATEYNCEIRLPEEYVGHDCLVTEKENVNIDGNDVTILDNDLVITKRLRPFRKGESRLRLPKEYLGKTIIILVKKLE